jgi:tripartite-type tricarboxylate transporter receptor subunit TctC
MSAAQAGFPDRPIMLMVGASPGGGVDAAARLIGRKISESLRQPVTVENRPGAYSRIANAFVAKSAPDGHTLLIATATAAIDVAVDPLANPNALRDFVPVSTIAMTDLILVVSPTLPVYNVAELVAYAQARPGELNYSTPGARTIYHLEGERFKLRTGIDIVHIPYRGLVPALAELISGNVEMSFASLPAALPLIRAGRVRALAVASAVRSPLLPDVPTLRESGVDGVDATVWYGILAPAGTPPDVVGILAGAIRDAARSPEYLQALLDMGASPLVTTPDEFGRKLRDEVARWGDVIKAAHVGLD